MPTENNHLNSEGGRVTYWFDLLPLQDFTCKESAASMHATFFSFSKQLSPNL